jgi:transglutaminase-like putative cysteine protease
VEQEAGHGWAEVHVPGLGWVGFDVSNAICPDSRYVRLAVGADYAMRRPSRASRAAAALAGERGAGGGAATGRAVRPGYTRCR